MITVPLLRMLRSTQFPYIWLGQQFDVQYRLLKIRKLLKINVYQLKILKISLQLAASYETLERSKDTPS